MDWLEQLVEARIRAWEREVRAGTAPPPPAETVLAEGLEVQLWRELVALRKLVRERPEAERAAIRARSADLELQLWVLLERSGRPLAAARLQAALHAL